MTRMQAGKVAAVLLAIYIACMMILASVPWWFVGGIR